MAKKNFGISYTKAMIEVKENDNSIWIIEHDKEGNEYYYNFTEEMKKLRNESNINIKVSFDNEMDWE